MPNLRTKKEVAAAFLQLASSGKVREAYRKYIHSDFLHHNPYFSSDRKSLQKGMEKSFKEFPKKSFIVLRTLEDGNMVAIHGKVQLGPGMPEIALMHLFRFKGNLIIEEWETAQQVPENSVNKNGMF